MWILYEDRRMSLCKVSVRCLCIMALFGVNWNRLWGFGRSWGASISEYYTRCRASYETVGVLQAAYIVCIRSGYRVPWTSGSLLPRRLVRLTYLKQHQIFTTCSCNNSTWGWVWLSSNATHQSHTASAFFCSGSPLRPVMQIHLGGILLNLFLLTSLVCSAAHPNISHSSLFLPCQKCRIQCDGRTERPNDLFFQDCQKFLWDLSLKSHEEIQGSFKWYGRNLGPCEDCVNLPTIVHFGKQRCAGLIDVDDKFKWDFSVFDLKELWQALSDVIRVCWLGEKHNGRGYPGSQTAWAGFVKGVGTNSKAISKGSLVRGNRTVTILDLSGEFTNSAVKSSPWQLVSPLRWSLRVSWLSFTRSRRI